MNEQWTAHLMEEYSDGLFRFLSMHTECREDAEDLMQDIFVNCYKARDSFDSSRCSEQAWIFVLAKNRLKNYYRDKKKTVSLDTIEYEKEGSTYMAQKDNFANNIFRGGMNQHFTLTIKNNVLTISNAQIESWINGQEMDDIIINAKEKQP